MYKITFKKSASKELKKIPKKEQIFILKAIKELENNPFPHGCKKLVGNDNTYRIRLGNYRVLYDLFKKELVIEVIKIGDRKNVYK